jgi:Ca-activated chloride channel family protein
MTGTRAVLCGVCIALAPLSAQQHSHPDFSVNSQLVIVPVTVTDRRGASVNGLPKEAFGISEDGISQQIASFSEDDAPVSIGIVLDLSGSMKDALVDARASLRLFAASSNPGDEAFLNTVSDRPRQWAGFTGDLDGLIDNVAYQRAAGNTALIDTVCLSLDQLRSAQNKRKALLVISDGMDNHSRYSRRELLDRLTEADAQIYTVSIDEVQPGAKPVEMTEQHLGLLLMSDLADATGGLQFIVRSGGDIEQAVAGISRALRNQYNIGYIPRNGEPEGKWRHIRVRVARNGMKAHTRAGYRSE